MYTMPYNIQYNVYTFKGYASSKVVLILTWNLVILFIMAIPFIILNFTNSNQCDILNFKEFYSIKLFLISSIAVMFVEMFIVIFSRFVKKLWQQLTFLAFATLAFCWNLILTCNIINGKICTTDVLNYSIIILVFSWLINLITNGILIYKCIYNNKINETLPLHCTYTTPLIFR
jgi:hypothetical protein